MSTLPTRGRRWIKRYFEIKGTKEYFFPPSPNLSNYILLALSRIHEPFVSRMRVVLPSFCSLSFSFSPPLPAKYPDKMPLVEISGEPVSWKFSGTSRPDVRVSSSIGPSHRQHRCSLSTEISIFPPVRIYSAPVVPIPLSFTFVFFLRPFRYDDYAERKRRSTPELLNSEDKIHRTIYIYFHQINPSLCQTIFHRYIFLLI